ncbi:MAG: TetR/AcrR family transcriptional regulator [Candidatus Aminicenantales bacterium]
MKKKDLRTERERQRREAYKKIILKAAESVILYKGLSATTMDDIADEAQFSKATLYRYFKSKGDIIFEIIANYLEEMSLRLKEIWEQEKSARERLRESLINVLHFQAEKQNISRALIMDKSFFKWMHICGADQDKIVPDMDNKYFQKIKAKRQKIVNGVCKLLAEGVASGEFRKMDIPAVAFFLESAFEGYFHTQFWQERKRNLEEDIRVIFPLILQGIEKKGGPNKGEIK